MPVPRDVLEHQPHRADVAPSTRAGEVAIVTRARVVESRHLGHGVLVDPDGHVVAAVGDPTTVVFPRSSCKPWQATTIRRHGARHDGGALDGGALAITAGSHDGSIAHRDLVLAMLDGAGLDTGHLQCPPALPGSERARDEVVRDGGAPTSLAHNCSGKHAGMLLACVANDWPTEDYLEPDHPLQQAIRQDVEEATGRPVAHVAVDGCGAPAFAVALDGLARAAPTLLRDEDGGAVAAAMRTHPELVAGAGREDTEAMRALDGLVAKSGAEGVQLLVTHDGWATLVKVLDGSHRAAMTAALALLARAPDVDTTAAQEATRQLALGHGQPVGAVLPGTDVT